MLGNYILVMVVQLCAIAESYAFSKGKFYYVSYLNFYIKRLYFKKSFKIILFLAALGLCCCTQAFASCGEQGLPFRAVPGLLVAVASLVAEHGP